MTYVLMIYMLLFINQLLQMSNYWNFWNTETCELFKLIAKHQIIVSGTECLPQWLQRSFLKAVLKPRFLSKLKISCRTIKVCSNFKRMWFKIWNVWTDIRFPKPALVKVTRKNFQICCKTDLELGVYISIADSSIRSSKCLFHTIFNRCLERLMLVKFEQIICRERHKILFELFDR